MRRQMYWIAQGPSHDMEIQYVIIFWQQATMFDDKQGTSQSHKIYTISCVVYCMAHEEQDEQHGVCIFFMCLKLENAKI